jgi:hypothetical protein
LPALVQAFGGDVRFNVGQGRKHQFAKERLCAASCIETINVIGSSGDT